MNDLNSTKAYTFHNCMDACLNYNPTGSGNNCTAVTYNGNTTALQNGEIGSNCFLKTKAGMEFVDAEESVASAVLIY